MHVAEAGDNIGGRDAGAAAAVADLEFQFPSR